MPTINELKNQISNPPKYYKLLENIKEFPCFEYDDYKLLKENIASSQININRHQPKLREFLENNKDFSNFKYDDFKRVEKERKLALIELKSLQSQLSSQLETLKENKKILIDYIERLASLFNQLTNQNKPHPETIKEIDGDNWENKLDDLDLDNLELVKTEYRNQFLDHLTGYYVRRELPELEENQLVEKYNELVEQFNQPPKPIYWPIAVVIIVFLFFLFLIWKYLIQPIIKKLKIKRKNKK